MEVVAERQLGDEQRFRGGAQGATLRVVHDHGEHALLLRALQHGGEQVGRTGRLAGEDGLALRQLSQRHRAQHGGVAVDDGLADFRAQLGAEPHDQHRENGHEQRARGDRG